MPDSTERLVIAVRFAEGRFHGQEWPPSPARLFQAIVAGVGTGQPLTQDEQEALRWIEALPPPVIVAARAKEGNEVVFYVPRNDGDVLGTPLGIETIRYAKTMRPWLFDERQPLIYAWPCLAGEVSKAIRVGTLVEHLHRLGHGVDMAWASCELVGDAEFDERIRNHPGLIHRPTGGAPRLVLACPTRGSVQGLVSAHEAGARALRRAGRSTVRTQPPRARFVLVAYDSPPSRRLYELRQAGDLFAWPAPRTAEVTSSIRTAVAARLERGLQGGFKRSDVDSIRILPLPSIGHPHADGRVRRVLVEAPANVGARPEDVFWALSSLEIPQGCSLRPAVDGERMLANYGIGEGAFSVWRTETPAALPQVAGRRRIEPARKREEAKPAKERIEEEMRAAAAVVRDLRAVQLLPQLEAVRVQREPFDPKGARAEAYAPGSGFAKERLWHVEVTFREPVPGPIVVGEGHRMGLGLMAPGSRDEPTASPASPDRWGRGRDG